jgi:hypothetical protein
VRIGLLGPLEIDEQGVRLGVRDRVVLAPAAGAIPSKDPVIGLVDRDGRGYLWDTRTSHAVDYACRVAGRDLTPVEWQTYVGTPDRQDVCPQ